MSLAGDRVLIKMVRGLCLALLIGNSLSCSVTSLDSIRRCRVFEDVGGKSTPAGLITLPQELKESLLAQLPKSNGEFSNCWYVYGEKLVVANYAREGEAVSGFVFLKGEEGWKLDSEAGIILAVPSHTK